MPTGPMRSRCRLPGSNQSASLGLMPNYRAVTAGATPPPPSPKQAFHIATNNSFDYSSFVFVGLTSMITKGKDSHPKLGKGVPGLWAYSWRGFLDKADGNYWVIFTLREKCAVFHLKRNEVVIVEANKVDLRNAEKEQSSHAVAETPELDHEKIEESVAQIESLIQQEDRIGKTISEMELDGGLVLERSCPIGVIGWSSNHGPTHWSRYRHFASNPVTRSC